MDTHAPHPRCFILPPHMLVAMAERGDDAQRQRAIAALRLTERFRGRRESMRLMAAPLPVGQKRRSVFDALHKTVLPGKLVRSEGDADTDDVAVNEAYDGAGSTYDFYRAAYDRNSIDDHGMRLDSSVHYSTDYDNAFWNGREMIYGDGDGDLFERFTIAVDVIGHELTHGVTAAEANLDYADQPGALNESFSDVFGSLVKQWTKKQTAAEADWLIGEGLFTPKVRGVALRSMKAPGTAYDDPVLGSDPQPADMSGFYTGTDDDGGVHINSGIPNHAFYLAATAIGGHAWAKAGLIWYRALTNRLRHDATFATAANALVAIAGELFGATGSERKAVSDAWKTVGVLS